MDRSIEECYADRLRGGSDNSPLATAGYKFSMAQAGYPLRIESFYLHYRRGGALFIPFDFEKVIDALRPRLPDSREQGFLLANGYGLTPAMEAALRGELKVHAQKKGTWANEHEPIVVPRGPSFLVSWFEDLVIAFRFPMQIVLGRSIHHQSRVRRTPDSKPDRWETPDPDHEQRRILPEAPSREAAALDCRARR